MSRDTTTLTRRKLLAMSTSLVVVAACAPATTGATDAATAAASKAPQAPKAPVTIRFWYIAQGTAFDPVVKAAVKDFEDSHPSIKVEVDVQPVVDMRAKVRPLLTSGGPGPDVFYDGAVQALTYASLPLGFIDVTDRVKAAGLRDKTLASAWAPMESKGKTFGIPLLAFPFLVGYNKHYYEAAGVTSLPQTWDEFLATVKRTTVPSKDQFGYLQLTNRFVSWFFETLMYDSGVGYFKGSENFTEFDVSQPLTFNGPEGVRALDFMRDLAATAPGGLKGNINVDQARMGELFAKGTLAHVFGHSIFLSQIVSTNPALVGGKDFDVYPMPKGPKRQGVEFATEVLGVTKLSRDPDAAWEFVKFISDKWEGRLAASIANVPVRRDATIPSNEQAWLLQASQKALAGDAFTSAFFPQLDAVREPLGKHVQAFFLGQKTAKEALDAAAAEFTKVLRP